MTARRHLPLPGPIDTDPTAAVRDLAGDADPEQIAAAMLTAALEGIQLGSHDQRIVAWLATWDVSTTATVASLMRRCWQAGAAAHNAELEEQIEQLRAQLGHT